MKLIDLKKDPEEYITYFDIKNLNKGEAIEYFIGTTDEAHGFYNFKQMRIVKEAVKDGLITCTQRLVKRTVIKKDIGLDKVNVFAYTLIRI